MISKSVSKLYLRFPFMLKIVHSPQSYIHTEHTYICVLYYLALIKTHLCDKISLFSLLSYPLHNHNSAISHRNGGVSLVRLAFLLHLHPRAILKQTAIKQPSNCLFGQEAISISSQKVEETPLHFAYNPATSIYSKTT